MRHECSFRLDPSGFAEGMESVTNDTDVEQKVRFSAAWFGSHLFNPRSDLIPLQEGLFSEERIYNQVPDWAEDLPRKTGELGAPWLGMSCPDRSFMVHFKGWSAMQYDAPETEDILIDSGRTASSPPLRALISEGGTNSLLRNARALGWEIGDTEKRIGFLSHNLHPVMADGSELTLSHALRGKRSASIAVDGLSLAEGQVCSGTSLTAPLEGSGPGQVTLGLAGRNFVYPIHRLGKDVPEVSISEADGLLQIENGRMKAILDPGAFGHVFGLKLDGVEYLMSSHPEPTEFAWEKPWFGGIHPRICDHQEKPFRLDTVKPFVERVVPAEELLPECGWSMAWDIDHKKFGSLRLVWKVTMIPGLPVLRTSFSHEALSGAYPGTESDIRGFLAPGGSHGEAVLTEESRPHLRQGRDTAGAWSIAGKWARVESPSRGFIEAYPNDQGPFYVEDYADSGCHLSLYSFTDRKRELGVTWLFGATKEDEHLSGIFRSYR
ncbi:hypothetical protein DRQ25_16995 [Candidatus Fermentibacteria bacterium]|nr:MAG: hypothetical protein DRQ25_16995 [Candidatus Fermentibacteria bacterium]